MPNAFYLAGEEPADRPYHYRACGLEGIFLINGYEVEEHDGERSVAITDMEGLHRAIGRHIVMQRKSMTPKEIRFLRNTMDLTQSELAQRLSNNSQSVARWEKGETEIPGASEKLLRAVYLASLMDASELSALQELLISRLQELDCMDGALNSAAQFVLSDHWSEKAKSLHAA